MIPLTCCNTCISFDKENNRMRNELRCMFCEEYQTEHFMLLYKKFKHEKGCSTCKYCRHIIDYPGFVTGEECLCEAGLACDTVSFSIQNCPKWIGIYEVDKAKIQIGDRND